MFHVDGLIDADDRVVFILPSRYVNGGLDFELGAPYGSVTLDPVTQSGLYRSLTAFATRCVEAIGLRHGAFHLELFQKFNGELVFIEVAARIPGCDAPWMIHEATGVNLFGEWLNLIMGRPGQIEPRTGVTAAWVMFPRPGGLPRRVTAVSSFLGRVPSVCRELVPDVGSVLEPEQGYCSMQAGRFLFCGNSAGQVNHDVQQVLSEFSISTVALDSHTPELERTAPMGRKALLLLAHQGRGYFAAIQQSLHELGVACLVLSSKPRYAHDEEDLVRLAPERLWVAEDTGLEERHVARTLEEAKAEGYEVVAALATFEGYRRLMAEFNHQLGAKDSAPADIVLCMDKYLCRRHLCERGLSHSNAVLLDAQTLAALQADPRPRFVKPRRGAASFACFRLNPDLTIDELHELQQQMRTDVWLNAMFLGQFDFIAEDYIPGDEYSFEVLVLDADSYVIGVHAKFLCESGGTTLEVSTSLPAHRLSDAQELAGEQYIARCLRALNMNCGCYHIEARFDPRTHRWDIIEINVRMGGALINQSVGVFTGGPTLLDLWIRVLCCSGTAESDALHFQLSTLRESVRRANKEIVHGSVFITRYGERNRTVEHISIAGLPRQPDIYDIPVRAGSKLPDSQRGIFILNALWKVDVEHIARELSQLAAMVDDSFVIRYAGAELRTGKENDMNRVTRCGIERPAPFFSLQDGERIRARLDSYLDKLIAVWAATVPYANHLESKELNIAWYRRHTIEHVWRIRLSRAAHTRALHEIAKISPEAAQLYGQYQAEEMNHDLLFLQDCKAIGVTDEELLNTEPFRATRLLQGFFYFVCEHEHPMGVVASSYLIEYTTAKLTPRHIRGLRESLGEEKIRGQLAHINTDLGDDHAGEMWRILRYLLNSEADVEKVLRYFDDVKEISAMYFRELYEATVAPSKAA
jgi:biotin carboxylase